MQIRRSFRSHARRTGGSRPFHGTSLDPFATLGCRKEPRRISRPALAVNQPVALPVYGCLSLSVTYGYSQGLSNDPGYVCNDIQPGLNNLKPNFIPGASDALVWFDGGAHFHTEGGDHRLYGKDLDISWSGSADNLGLEADQGNLTSTVQTAGNLLLNIYGTIVDARGNNVVVYSGDGGMTGGAKAIVADNVLDYALIDGGVESTSSGARTGMVTAMGTVSSVFAGTEIDIVNAGGLDQVTAGTYIGHVRAHGSIAGNVTARGGDIGNYTSEYNYIPGMEYSNLDEPFVSGPESFNTGGVFAGSDISGDVRAEGDITVVHALGNISGGVLSLGEIYIVRSEEGSIGGGLVRGSTVGTVDAEDSVSAKVIAKGGSVGAVRAGGDIGLPGGVTAEDSISYVSAGGGIAQVDIKAVSGAVTYLEAGGGIATSRIYGSRHVGLVKAGSIADSQVIADTGRIGTVTAEGAISQSDFTARKSLKSVSGASIIGSNVTSEVNFIEGVYSTVGSIDATISAKTDITEVEAQTSLKGTLDAQNIVDVATIQQDIEATITASIAIGKVSAGRSIKSPITAGMSGGAAGNIGHVLAGTFQPGSITAPITAGNNITSVQAIGIHGPTALNLAQSGWSSYQAALEAWKNSPNPDPSTFPVPPRSPKAVASVS
ncbi:MAG: hypothetical protein H8E66_34865 [Planctomycetes bacterium]|nr:hypothetical protein [Planctomycetota bacterium]